jgi:hypothetical protein
MAEGRGGVAPGMRLSHASHVSKAERLGQGGLSGEQVGVRDALVEVERRRLLAALRQLGFGERGRACVPEVDLGRGTRRGSRGN